VGVSPPVDASAVRCGIPGILEAIRRATRPSAAVRKYGRGDQISSRSPALRRDTMPASPVAIRVLPR
jgi:hypothetical protein